MNINIVLGLTVSFALGTFCGYFVTKRKISKENSEWIASLSQEVDDLLAERGELRERLSKKDEEKSDGASLAQKNNDKDFTLHVSDRLPPSEDAPTREPFVINEEELEYEYSESEYSTLTYYRGDAALVDECDEYISNVVELLGEDIADSLYTCDKDCLYVHNDSYDTNFEIIFDDGVYGLAENRP